MRIQAQTGIDFLPCLWVTAASARSDEYTLRCAKGTDSVEESVA